MQQMEISKTFSVKDLDFLRDKKVVSYWQKRDFLTEKKSESIFEGKRGSILVSIVSNNISKKKIKLNIIFDEKDTKMKNYYKSAKKKNVFLSILMFILGIISYGIIKEILLKYMI